MIELLWWHWAILGCGLLVLDALVLNIYYPFWFGVGAVFTALATAIFADMPAWGQIVIFALSSLSLLALWLFVLRPRQTAKNMQFARLNLPGQAGVIVYYNDKEKRGTIRLQKPVGGKDVWEFLNAAAPSPRPGERATIEDIDENGIAILAVPKEG